AQIISRTCFDRQVQIERGSPTSVEGKSRRAAADTECKQHVAKPHPGRLSMARMDTITAPTPAAGGQAPESGRAAALIDVRVTDIETVARDTNVYTFRRSDGGRLPPYKPGAHIDMHLPNGLIRPFSLLNPAADPESYVVAIKLDAASRGGSRYIFDD